ncbi:MAG: hypothetical protein IKS07_09840, partial [Lachnospiraceae bacterium]|nr:hypothetical protein [Lachnospiraceae bacterium]
MRNVKKWMALGLSIMMTVSVTGCGLESIGHVSAEEYTNPNVIEEEDLEENLEEALVGQTSTGKQKEETVYVVAGADGAAQKIIVSNWLKNPEGADKLQDASDLQSIENVKGDETYTGSGNSMVWNAGGNDIYYRGTTEKELPIKITVKYYLDGNEIAPADLAGKSGHVTIRYAYENTEKQTVRIGDEDAVIYTPFGALTGLILDGENFSNVEVTSGNVINDGSKYVVMGMAFPGLRESLALDENKLADLGLGDLYQIPDTLEISADTTDFELTMALTVISSDVTDVLGMGDVSDTEGLDSLEEDMNKLQDGSDALLGGAGDLLDGAGELL